MNKNRSLLETYHVSSVFDDMLEYAYVYLLLLCRIFRTNFKLYTEKYNGKCKFTGYEYNNGTVVKKEKPELCKIPIYLKIVVSDGYKFSISRKIKDKIVIECNISILLHLYLALHLWEFKTTVKSGLKHEFLHVYQQQKDSLFDFKTFNKLDVIKYYLDNPDDLDIELTDDYKENIIAILLFALKTELDACLNGVTELLSSYDKQELYDKFNDSNHIITDNIIKECSKLVGEESKLIYILPTLQYIKSNNLIPVVQKINKYVHIYNGYIESYFKEYEVNILKLIYYVLHDIIKYDERYNVIDEMFKIVPGYFNNYFYYIYD